MEEEKGVGFHEHVFLSHLIRDFPTGPIRHYMELVVAGLSKNPYISVSEKHGHIEWYRDFLADKQKLIEESIEA
jgi:small subunit ribosomal protein S31